MKMQSQKVVLLLVMLASLLMGGVVYAQDEVIELSVTGVSGAEAQWVVEFVKPKFEAYMAEQGKTVNVTVIETLGSGEDTRQQFVLDLGVGSGSDIMGFDGFWLPEFVEGGLLKSLDELVGEEALAWEGWEHIPAGLQEIMGFDGKVYGIARGTDARVIWYRTDLFEQAGLPVDWQPTSWEELLEAARTIKAELPDVVPFQLNAGVAMGEATSMQGYLMALLGAGHHIYDAEEGKWIVSSPAILDTLNLYNTIYIEEELGDLGFQLRQNGRDQSFEGFSLGTVAMLVEGDYLWRGPIAPETGNFAMENRDELVSYALMPAIEPGAGFNGQDFVTISGGTGYALNPNTAHVEEAWELLQFMFTLESLEDLQSLQPRIRARTDVPVTGDEVMSSIVADVLPYTTIRPQLPEYNRVSEQAQIMTERVVSGEMTPEEAMAAYAEAVAEIVGEDNVISLPLE